MSRLARFDWLVPLSLILLSAVPVAAGLYRAMTLLSGGPASHDAERFFAFPLSIIVHVLSTSLFCVLGALQFSDKLRRQGWHAALGKLVWTSGCVTAASGIWLTLVFPPGQYDGPCLFAVRLTVASGMLLCLLKGLQAVLRQDVVKHRGWMIQSYAWGMGAGTQVFTHLPFFFLPEAATELTRTLCMSLGWGINLAVAEWLIHSSLTRVRTVTVGVSM